MADFLSYRETIQLIEDFLETSIHIILYLRQIYPRELFQEKKEFDVLVWQSRHPGLNEYIGKIVKSVGHELGKGSLKRVAMVVKEAELEENPLERFIWDFDWLIPPDKQPVEGGDWTPKENGLPRDHLEDYLRAFLLKLTVSDTYLLKLPPDVTWAVVIELKDDAPRPESDLVRKGLEAPEWVPAEEREAPTPSEPSRTKDSEDIEMSDHKKDGRSAIVPLKTTRLGIINMQMLVEEMDSKFDGEVHLRNEEEKRKINARKAKGKGRAR